jgi:hypothetical protein
MIFKYHYFIFLIIISTFPTIIRAQSVRNIDPIAVDTVAPDTFDPPSGTCKLFHYTPRFISKLPARLNETSGLVFFNHMLWTINDGSNPAELYQMDTASGKVLRTVVITNSKNTDWESLAQDDSNLYIGDFGNNYGNRTDLCILKIPKSVLLDPGITAAEAGYINFRYANQDDFAPALNQTDFDCEAFFYAHDSLHLFSKEWLSGNTRHYVLTADTGFHTARLAETFYADGLITDASVNANGNIVLLGYKNAKGKKWKCFCWIFQSGGENGFLSCDKTRIKLGKALRLGQTEGIYINNDNTGWITSESIASGRLHRPAKLFRFNFNKFLQQ